MAIESSSIKHRLGNLNQIGGSAIRENLVASFSKTKIGKKYNLHRTRGVSAKELDKRLKNVLGEMDINKRDIEKIYASNKSPVKGAEKIIEGIFKEVGRNATKGYEKKEILESIDNFAQTSSETEFKSERQSRSGGWRGLFRRKNKQEKEGGKFAAMEQEQIGSAVNSDSAKVENEKDDKKEIRLQTHVHQVKTKLEEEDDDDQRPRSPLPQMRR